MLVAVVEELAARIWADALFGCEVNALPDTAKADVMGGSAVPIAIPSWLGAERRGDKGR